jgi:hypothetical protein
LKKNLAYTYWIFSYTKVKNWISNHLFKWFKGQNSYFFFLVVKAKTLTTWTNSLLVNWTLIYIQLELISVPFCYNHLFNRKNVAKWNRTHIIGFVYNDKQLSSIFCDLRLFILLLVVLTDNIIWWLNLMWNLK